MSAHSAPLEATTAEPVAVKAVYKHLDCLVDGIHELKQAGFRPYMHVITPFPRHEVEELMYEGEPSPVRWFTLFGGAFGGTMAFTMTALMSANWPMIMPGGKPLVSVPPFIVITFEGTILWACLFTFIALLLFSRLPARDLPKEVEDPRFSNDHFGIVLERLPAEEAAKAKSILHHSGAIEVTGGGDSAAHGAHHG
jgi:hypothetical protein